MNNYFSLLEAVNTLTEKLEKLGIKDSFEEELADLYEQVEIMDENFNRLYIQSSEPNNY